jgi:hypothetical protein
MRLRFVAALAAAPLLTRHPMHTSVTELRHEPATHRVEVTLRVFADDFTAAAGQGDDAAARYLAGRFTLADRSGRPVALRLLRRESADDALILQLVGEMRSGLTGARVRQQVLCDRFDDQVNLVRASYARRSASLLFTPGAGEKTLP